MYHISICCNLDYLTKPAIKGKTIKGDTISLSLGNSQRSKFITKYSRLDLGLTIEVGFIKGKTPTLSVVPGGFYKVQVWITQKPSISLAREVTYKAMEKSTSMHTICTYVYNLYR